jgi:tRNA-uridine 2-sulfurtransferase
MSGADKESAAPRKILVALSGGVDSSVAAALLRDQYPEAIIEAAYMKNWINEEGLPGDCPWQSDIEDARAAADTLGIPFRVVNLMSEYREKVVNYLLEGYCSGGTPNPDVMCNREIKFGAFLQWATAHGFDRVATGHYARILYHSNGNAGLFEGCDSNKDQSYFLALLRQHQLRSALFPIGELAKPEVRERARNLGLPTAAKKDSQGICFIGNIRMRDFLRAYLPDSPGAIVDPEGRTLGEHKGLHLYTIGQRRGVGVASPVANRAYVVVGKRQAANELVLALEGGDAPGLYSSVCEVGQLSFPGEEILPPCSLEVRPRYRAPRCPAKINSLTPDRWLVEFETPQRALTVGQIAAIHDGPELVAGGIILKTS